MKKFRLVMSLAMMFVSIAVLSFGVYAASQVTYTLSGTISYAVEDVWCTITGKVFTVSAQQDTTAMSSGITSLKSTALTSIANTTYTLDSSNTITDFTSSDTNTSGSKTGLSIAFASGKYTYYIVLHIKNNASKTFTASITNTTGTGFVTSKSADTTIASGAETNMIVAYSLSSKTADISVTLSNVLTCKY